MRSRTRILVLLLALPGPWNSRKPPSILLTRRQSMGIALGIFAELYAADEPHVAALRFGCFGSIRVDGNVRIARAL